jgi:hypothetical protein
MISCQACGRRTELYLCEDCKTLLANQLDDLPWLLDELDARIQQLARTSIGTIGRTSKDPAELTPIDFDAAETARAVRTKLIHWVTTVAERHSGRRMPALGTVHTKDLARWLTANLNAIQRLNIAGKLYRDIKTLVGTDQRGGQLVAAINRTERHCFGQCTTITGRDRHGKPRECGTVLWDDKEAIELTCPACGATVDARRQLNEARIRSDLRTFDLLLETLDNLNEHVPRVKLSAWVTTGRLPAHGYLNKDHGIVKHRIRRGDPRVFSLATARQLWRNDQKKTSPAQQQEATAQ